MTDDERKKMGERIRDFLLSHEWIPADAAREYSKKNGISFDAANVKISRIINGEYEPNMDFIEMLYQKFQVNWGFIVTGKGEPHVKPFD